MAQELPYEAAEGAGSTNLSNWHTSSFPSSQISRVMRSLVITSF